MGERLEDVVPFDKQTQMTNTAVSDDADSAGAALEHHAEWSNRSRGSSGSSSGCEETDSSNETAFTTYTRGSSQTSTRSELGVASLSDNNLTAANQEINTAYGGRYYACQHHQHHKHHYHYEHQHQHQQAQHRQLQRRQSRCSIENSPDLLNSRQLRRRVARYNSSNSGSKDEEAEIAASVDSGEGTPEISILGSLKNAALSSWLNVLIIFVPLGYLAHFLKWPVIAVFVLNYLAIIPLSALMGFATEEVSLRLGRTWGSVVNASFGNAVELIVAVIALIEEEYRIVQAGLIGSVLSNTLFLLGWAFLAGGLRHRVQVFHAEAAQCAGSLLALSVLSMIVPAAYHGVHASGGEITNGILIMSRGTALILLLVYILFLIFQLKTHSEIFDGSHMRRAEAEYNAGFAETTSANVGLNVVLDDAKKSPAGRAVFGEPSYSCESTGCSSRASLNNNENVDKEKVWRRNAHGSRLHRSSPQMRLWIAGTMFAIVSVLVALSSDVLVDSVEELTSHYNISHTFVGMILLPLAASAAEHTMSVTVAIRDRMDLCISVAVGSSMQMALFVLPTLIIIAWIMNRPLTLYFDDFETTTMLISVLVINYLIMNGRSNWLKGAMMLCSYFIVALAFFLYPVYVEEPRSESTRPAVIPKSWLL
ncbi:hypothetical protein H4217_004515 [Coemansia sp. RSA 1939]|nr:hypothetical protein H4217_004515 [Coemansia sp. RSA 1939]